MAVNDHGKPDQLELRLLRPEAWIREQRMLEGHVVNVALDDLNVSGPARVTRLGAWGQVATGKRCPVTGWVRHTSHDVIPLALEGNETLEVTRHHRLFSADRGTWVHAGDVQDGEALQTQDGAVRAMHAGSESLAPLEVFNLEVFGAHQYFVGGHRVLAHNVYATAAEAVSRPLVAADLGLAEGTALEGLKGTVTTELNLGGGGATRVISVDWLGAQQGSLVAQVKTALPNILKAARADGVTTLHIDANYINSGLQRFVQAATEGLGGTFSRVGGRDVATFVLSQ